MATPIGTPLRHLRDWLHVNCLPHNIGHLASILTFLIGASPRFIISCTVMLPYPMSLCQPPRLCHLPWSAVCPASSPQEVSSSVIYPCQSVDTNYPRNKADPLFASVTEPVHRRHRAKAPPPNTIPNLQTQDPYMTYN